MVDALSASARLADRAYDSSIATACFGSSGQPESFSGPTRATSIARLIPDFTWSRVCFVLVFVFRPLRLSIKPLLHLKAKRKLVHRFNSADMAKPKVWRAGTSYEKVMELIFHAKPNRDLREKVLRRLKSARLDSVSYNATMRFMDDGHVPCVEPQVEIHFGHAEELLKMKTSAPGADEENPGAFAIRGTISHLVTNEEIVASVARVFGVSDGTKKGLIVPTYGTKRDKVLEEYPAKFRSLLKDSTVSNDGEPIIFERLMLDVSARLTQDVIARFRNEKQLKQDTMDKFAIKKIRDVLMQFRSAPEHVLKQALDEFIVHDLMDS